MNTVHNNDARCEVDGVEYHAVTQPSGLCYDSETHCAGYKSGLCPDLGPCCVSTRNDGTAVIWVRAQ